MISRHGVQRIFHFIDNREGVLAFLALDGHLS